MVSELPPHPEAIDRSVNTTAYLLIAPILPLYLHEPSGRGITARRCRYAQEAAFFLVSEAVFHSSLNMLWDVFYGLMPSTSHA